MIGRIFAIALNTFREAIRQRVLYGILAVVVALNVFGVVIGEMSLHQEARVARDIGLAGISLFGSITAIVLGVSLLYTEIQRRTIHTLVSKPLSRWEFVLGKYFGMAATLTLLVFAFALAMLAVLEIQEVDYTNALYKAVFLSYIEVLTVAGIAIFFSSFSSPYLSGIFTFGLFFLGRAAMEMRAAIEQADNPVIVGVCKAALFIVPNLSLYSVSGAEVGGKHVSVHGDNFVDFSYMLTAAGHGLLYTSALLILAVVIFSRRQFV